MRDTVEFNYYGDVKSFKNTVATFMQIMFKSMSNVQTIALHGINGTNITNMFTTDMPFVTGLDLTRTDFTPDVIKYILGRKFKTRHMPNLQMLSMDGLNGNEIINMFTIEIPYITKLKLKGTDISCNLIPYLYSKMKGLQEISIYTEYKNNKGSTVELIGKNMTFHFSQTLYILKINGNDISNVIANTCVTTLKFFTF